eukprot:PLAT2539.2.p1 GENE.PLAT2539.2~~PLAT2539.2.p1  ORF type:complete len:515 (-),score=136.24 PLAT2539.2:49-1593(-)
MASESEEESSAVKDDCIGHVLARLPDSLLEHVVSLLSPAEVELLAGTCSWLRTRTLRSVRSISVEHWSSGSRFPAAALAQLSEVRLSGYECVTAAMPELLRCPQVSKLSMDNGMHLPAAAVIDSLPCFDQLESINIAFFHLTTALGRAVASCPKLRDVSLAHGYGAAPDGDMGEEERTAGFVRELAAGCSKLHKLQKLPLLDAAAERALLAALPMWERLEVLSVNRRDEAVGLRGIAAVAQRSCPQLSLFWLDDYTGEPCELGSGDAAAISRMSNLRILGFSEIKLPISLFSELTLVRSLTELQIARCIVDDATWADLPALVSKAAQLSKLRVSTMYGHSFPAAAAIDVLAAIATTSALEHVSFEVSTPRLPQTSKQQAAVAFADALCCSAVTYWQLGVRFCLLSFLQAWDERSASPVVQNLWLTGFDDASAVAADDFVPLLLRFFHSLPSHCSVWMDQLHATEAVVGAVIEAVKQAPLCPRRVSVCLYYEIADKFTDYNPELTPLGLTLERAY